MTRGQQLNRAVFSEGERPIGRGQCHRIFLADCYHRRSFVEYLLCAWHCSRCWRGGEDDSKDQGSQKPFILTELINKGE